MARVTVDGRVEALDEALPLLEALERCGVHVPHMCHDARLHAAGACRLCLVEIDGHAQPVTSCTIKPLEGMVVRTAGCDLTERRRGVLRLMAHRYPSADDADLPQGNPFLTEVAAHQLEAELRTHPAAHAVDDSHPYIHIDMARCVHCFRCERICRDLQGQMTWRVWNRGGEQRLVPDSGTTLRESSCVSCGACVDTCPSGALEDKSVRALGAPQAWKRTVCPYCGVGCELNVGTRGNRIVQVRPALDAPANKGHACVKGRYAFGFIGAPDRITTPMIRKQGTWREVALPEAIAFAAGRLNDIIRRRGPEAVGVLGSARSTNEENYLAQKLARVVLGTNNVDNCARVCHAPSAAALSLMLGTGAATSSFDDIELARTILVAGSNTTENHPVVGARIRQSALHGANLIVIDPRAIELTEYATIHLQPKPGTNIPLLHAMARVVLSEQLMDSSFVAARVDGFDEFWRVVDPWTLPHAAETCGVEPELIARAARLVAQARPALFFNGLGLTEHLQGTESVMALVNLALLTGNIGQPGTGVNPLRGQNNVQGSAHMGCTPNNLTGGAPLEKEHARFAQVWGEPLPTTRGLDWMQMVDAAREGKLGGLYAIGYDVLLSNPNASDTEHALSKLELLIVQDMFMTETARALAHVFLPVACSFEKDGTFMSSERRVQRVRKTVEPPAGVLDDARLVAMLAAALGHPRGFEHENAEQIWDEVRAVWPDGAGMSYARLDQPGGLQWPCPNETHPGTVRLHTDAFGKGLRASLRGAQYRPSPERESEAHPYVLVTGRLLYQFNAATMTGRTPNQVLQPTDVLRMSPADAAREGLKDGDRVLVLSRYGSAELPLKLDAAQRPGELFTTFHDRLVFINRVTGNERDSYTHTPELKRTAVRVARAPLT